MQDKISNVMQLKITPTKSTERPLKKYRNVPVNLTKEKIAQIDEIVRSEGSTRSEVIRYAIERLLISRRQDYYDERETTLVRKLEQMEKSLQTLVVKGIRLNAQALYFSALPFELGPPRAALTKESYQHQYERSLGFAAMVLKDKTTLEQSDVPSKDRLNLIAQEAS
jgi:Arc/MetJ-type ribon-helix-helix transcriptional regulator